MTKLLPQSRHELLPDLVLQIKLLIIIPLLSARIPANGADIDHPIPEFDEGASLDGDVKLREISQDEVHQLLVLVLAEPLDEGVRFERDAELECREAVFREAVVEERGDVDL